MNMAERLRLIAARRDVEADTISRRAASIEAMHQRNGDPLAELERRRVEEIRDEAAFLRDAATQFDGGTA